jgi:creatinine amidohydrolase/Fe(II)-dependent formamide hydrolase-like protein
MNSMDGQIHAPVVYIPVGSLEWHGVQNPLGTDGLKAHAICCEAALRYGGVMLPTLFLGIWGQGRGWEPEGWDGYTVTVHGQASLEETLYRVARGLVADGLGLRPGPAFRDDGLPALHRPVDH